MNMESIIYGKTAISMMQLCEIRVKENPKLKFTVRGGICFRTVHEGNEVTDWKVITPPELEQELKQYSEITVYGAVTETLTA